MRMPVIFSGHDAPMIAPRDNEITKTFAEVGKKIFETYDSRKRF